VVVYKIDRLIRSLTDFSRMIEVFERHGVSFVSVTQQFNTTTSMGRLMLNILLSFAQFEREVSRMVNLTTLAPDIVAAILDEVLPPEVTLFDLSAGTPLLWGEQRGRLVGINDLFLTKRNPNMCQLSQR